MDYRASQMIESTSPHLNFDEKHFTLNYFVALGIVAVVITIAFAAINFIIPSKSEQQIAVNILADQQVLIQKIVNSANQLQQESEQASPEQILAQLKSSCETLQNLHQSLLYGNNILGLGKLTNESVKKIYFHPENSLDKMMSDYLVNAKLLIQLPVEKAVAANDHTQRIQQLANGEMFALLQQVQDVYRNELQSQAGGQRWMLFLLWTMVIATLAMAGFFIFRPASERLMKFVESLKKSRFQMLALKKKAEAEKSFLEKSLLRSQAALDAAPQAMMVYNNEDREVKINKAFCDMWQLPDVVSLEPRPDNLRKILQQKLRNAADLPEKFLEFSHADRSNRTYQLALDNGRFAECNVRPIQLGETILGKAWLFVDTTRHLMLAKKFSDQARHFQNVLNSIADGVVVTDAEGKLSHYNPAAESLLGISKELVATNDWHRQFQWQDSRSDTPISDAELPFLRTTAGEDFDGVHIVMPASDETQKRRMNASGRPVRNHDGRVTGGVVIIRQQADNMMHDPAGTTLDQFLENVNEGVFFINEKLEIQPKYSKSLERLLSHTALQHDSVLDLFRELASPQLVGVIEDYIRLIFHSVVTDKYVEDLNPLQELEIKATDPQKGPVTRHLSFSFNRMFQSEKIQSMMITVRDVTDQVASVKKLKRSQAKIQKQIDLLFRVIHVDPSLLEKFIEDCAAEIAAIHFLLKKDELAKSPKDILLKISRSLVNVKENAAFLDLRIFEEKAARFEKAVLLNIGKSRLSRKELDALQKELADLHDVLDEVKRIIDHLINKLKIRFRGKREEECRRLMGSIENYVKRESRKQGKKVQIDLSRFNALDIPFADRQSVREVIIDILRRMITNSIETPQERDTIGKMPNALIELHTVKSRESTYEFTIRDDGRGMELLEPHNSKELYALASETNGTKNLHNNTNGLVLNEQFFSIANINENKNLTKDLKPIEKRIKKLGGKIHAFSQHGTFSEFYISLPKS